MSKQIVKVSVRNLVEFVLRSGDIDNRIAAKDKDAMQLGAKLHRKIQRRMGASYHPEVTLRHEEEFEGFCIQVEGRADGIITEDTACIDEIKGIFLDLKYLTEPVPVHLAQQTTLTPIWEAFFQPPTSLADLRVSTSKTR